MNVNPSICDPERIELFLQQKLSDQEQAAFESHLSECHDCCRRLDVSAASQDVWQQVRDSLRNDQQPQEDADPPDSAFDSTAGEEAFSSQATVLKLLAPTDDDRMLGRWGTYEVVGVVGTGGMGVVLKALDAALNRYVAIKILAPHLGSSGAARKRFSREAQASAAVVHDNVIEIYGVSEAAGLPYLVMPYVRGPSLQRRLDDEGSLAVAEILRVGMQAAAGLAAAHAQGLVHRDVKPANILLADGIERVKLTDFGLARAADDASLTKTGYIAGTPLYMSPEQARGAPVDQRSDLFSLGSVLYAMCTGRPPFRAETSYGVLRRITDEEPRPIREINPDIPDWLCGIVGKLMAKQPEDRFQSAQEVSVLLQHCLAHVQQPTAVPLPTYSPLPSAEGQGVRAVQSCKDGKDSKDNNDIKARAARRRNIPNTFLLGTLAMLTLLGISLFAISVANNDPPYISGNWQGDDWGQVTLTQTAPGEYTGTYTDTVAKEKGPGKIDLKWSRIEHRYNGTWREGEDDRFGDLSIHLVGQEIRGGLTTSDKSKINPATPKLAELVWTRVPPSANREEFPRDRPVELLSRINLQSDHVAGEWEESASGLMLCAPKEPPDEFSRVMLPVKVTGSYDLEVAFTRTSAVDKYREVNIAIPVGAGQCMIILDGWGGIASGLQDINGREAVENPTRTGANLLTDGRKYILMVRVRLQGENADLTVLLDGKPIVRWTGPQSSLSMKPSWALAERDRPELMGKGSIATFHSVRLRLIKGKAAWVRPARTAGALRGGDTWGSGRRIEDVPERALPAGAVQWSEAKGGNGHWYEAVSVPGAITWTDAKKAARAKGGYLATITSAEENAFVYSLVDDDRFWHLWDGPWLGGAYDSKTKAWHWVTGEPWGYTNWYPGQPDHIETGRPYPQDSLHFYGTAYKRTPMWDDNWHDLDNPVGYVVEWNSRPQLPAPPPHSHAVQFDGQHYAKVEQPLKFTSGDFTISVWFNPVRSDSPDFMFMRGLAFGDQRGDIGLGLHRETGNLDFEAAGGANQWIFGWSPEPRLHGAVRYGQWNHGVVTRRGDIYTMWINGEKVATERSAADISDEGNTNPFIVGGFMGKNGVQETYRGQIDDFRIFHRCLSDKEIGTLYDCGGDAVALGGEGRVKLAPLVKSHLRGPTEIDGLAPLPSLPAANPSHALHFDGASGYVDLGHRFNFKKDSPFSVTFWIKSAGVDQQMLDRIHTGDLRGKMNDNVDQQIVGNSDIFFDQGAPGWTVFTNKIGALYFRLDASGKPGVSMLQAYELRTSLTDGRWHHVAVSYNGNQDVSGVAFYIDGASQPLGTDSNNLRDGEIRSSAHAAIGATSTGKGFFKGELSEMRIYDCALTAADVPWLYIAELIAEMGNRGSREDRGLIAGYHFDEGHGTTVHDFSGHGNTGTLHGGVHWVYSRGTRAGRHANAVQFDGRHYAKVEQPPKFTSGDFTISLWFNPVRVKDWIDLFARGFAWHDQQGDVVLKFHRDSGDLDFQARTGDHQWLFGWDFPESRLRSTVRYGQWNHAVVTRRGETYALWMNGERVASEKSSADISDVDNTNPFIVGGMMGDGDMANANWYEGALDDLRIFRRCLSDKEVGTLYDCGGDAVALGGEGRVKFGPLMPGCGVDDTGGAAAPQTDTLEAAQARFDAAKAKAEDERAIRHAFATAEAARRNYEAVKRASEQNPGSAPKEVLLALPLKCAEADLDFELAKFNKRLAGEEFKVAKAELEFARIRRGSPSPSALAAAAAQRDVQAAEARYNLASIKAGNDVDVHYATAAAAACRAECEIAAAAVKGVPGAITDAKLDEVSLRCKEADLAVEKAKHEQRFAKQAAIRAMAELRAAQRELAEKAPGAASPSGDKGPDAAHPTKLRQKD